MKNIGNSWPPTVSHTGVHDHGFNNVSTYGNLLRLMVERKNFLCGMGEKTFYETGVEKFSVLFRPVRWNQPSKEGRVQCIPLNGPHSLFCRYTSGPFRVLMLSIAWDTCYRKRMNKKVNLLVSAACSMPRLRQIIPSITERAENSFDIWGRTPMKVIFQYE